jgi:hypothetical protein
MAIAKAFDENPLDYEDIDFGVREYAIGGKMVEAAFTLSSFDTMVANIEDEIKDTLARNIAVFIIKNKLIEFTKTSNPTSYDITYRARCYLTPDEMVKILRVHAK